MSAPSLKNTRLSDPTTPPQIKIPDRDLFPFPLASLKVFCPWQLEFEASKGKWVKRPHRIGTRAKGYPDKWNEPQNLHTMEEVLLWIGGKPEGRTLSPGDKAAGWGVGMVGATGEGTPMALDFDNVVDELGRITNPDVTRWIEATSGGLLWERSLSGTGFHAIGLGLELLGEEKEYALHHGGEVELLINKRFCALTGDYFTTIPETPGGIQTLYQETWDDGQYAKEVAKEKAPERPKDPPPPPTTLRGKELRDLVKERATAWVEKREPSVAGQYGHKSLMEVASVLKWGYGYGDSSRARGWEADGYAIFQDYNARAVPPESMEDIERKWNESKDSGNGQDHFSRILADHQAFEAKRPLPPSGQSQPQKKPAKGREESPPLSDAEMDELLESSFVDGPDIPEREKIQWLWRNHIERGKFGIISGYPNIGKSTAIAGLCAAISRPARSAFAGGSLPGYEGGATGERVLWVTCEEDASLVRDRFQLAGGDITKLTVLELLRPKGEDPRHFVLPYDFKILRRHVEKKRPAVIVLDSATGLIAAEYDLTKSQKSREVVNPLVAMAKELDTAIVLVSHLTKGSSERTGPEFLRAEGSVGLLAATRFILTVQIHPEDKDDDSILDHLKRRVLYGARVSNGETGWMTPFKTRVMEKKITDGESKTVIPVWEDAVRLGDSAFATKSDERERPGPKAEQRETAGQAILEVLEKVGGGWLTAKEMEDHMKAIGERLGVSHHTVLRARTELKGLKAVFNEKVSDGSGVWFLPGHDPRPKDPPKGTPPVNLEEKLVGIFEAHGKPMGDWELIYPLGDLKVTAKVTRKAIDDTMKILIGSGKLLVSGNGNDKTYRLAGQPGDEAGQGEEGEESHDGETNG